MTAADNIIVEILTNEGLTGWGEASPFLPITGDTRNGCFDLAKTAAEIIKGKDPCAVSARMQEINRQFSRHSSVLCAFDMALWDILAQRAGLPLYAVLGGEHRSLHSIQCVGMQTEVAQTVEQAGYLLDAGFIEIKMKVGRTGLKDVAHVSGVGRLAGPDVPIRIDANQGWDFPTAKANLNAMADLNIQFAEQPLPAWDLAGLSRLRQVVNQPVCADESVFDCHDALQVATMGAADYINLKLEKTGGISGAQQVVCVAGAAGFKCMIGCFASSRLGLTAAGHFAMANPVIQFAELDAYYLFRSDPVIGGITYDEKANGRIKLPDVPGLGCEIDRQYLSNDHTVVI